MPRGFPLPHHFAYGSRTRRLDKSRFYRSAKHGNPSFRSNGTIVLLRAPRNAKSATDRVNGRFRFHRARAVSARQGHLLRDPAGQNGRLLHPRRHLYLGEPFALADVDPARVLAARRTPGRDRTQ